MMRKLAAWLMIVGLWVGCGARENAAVYELTEYLDEAQFDRYMNDDGMLFRKTMEFTHRLRDASAFEFYAYANNFIEVIGEEVPESCVVNYGTPCAAESIYEIDGESVAATEAIQVSENFFELFPMKIAEGRGFEDADFERGDVMPVILGEKYRGYFDLGDTFEGYYICERRTFRVIGFMGFGDAFYLRSQSRMADYDGYIVMPFERVEEDSFSARAILLQQICGFVKPRGERDEALRAIQRGLTEVGLEDWTDRIVLNEKGLQLG